MYISASDKQLIPPGVNFTVFKGAQRIFRGTTPVVLRNRGTNPIAYNFQSQFGGTWSALGPIGTDYNNTIAPSGVALVNVASPYPTILLNGSSALGSYLDFGVLRRFERASGGAIPLVSKSG